MPHLDVPMSNFGFYPPKSLLRRFRGNLLFLACPLPKKQIVSVKCDAWRFQYQSWIFLFPNVLRGMLLRLFCSLHLELSSLQQVACLDSYNLSINKLISIKCSSLHHDQRLSKASFWLTMRSTCLIATPPHIDHRPHTSTHVLYIDFRWKKVVTISGALSYTGDVLRHLQKNKQTTWFSKLFSCFLSCHCPQ